MHTDKDKIVLSLKRFGYTVLLLFAAPITIYQAFKNTEHPLYYPVLILGLILAIASIAMGFYSIKTLMDAIFNDKKKKSK